MALDYGPYRQYAQEKQAGEVVRYMPDKFLERVFLMQSGKANPAAVRSLSERFPELTRINQTLVSTLLVISLDVIFSMLLVIFLFIVHPQLAMISLGSIVPIAIVSFVTSPAAKKRALAVAKEQRQDQMKLNEVIENTETIQSLNAEQTMREKLA